MHRTDAQQGPAPPRLDEPMTIGRRRTFKMPNMRSILTAALTAALMIGFSGCASLTGPAGAPTCDGVSRRPLNRSMWAWESLTPPARAETSPALPVREPGASSTEPAAQLTGTGALGSAGRSTSAAVGHLALPARYDVAASRRACTAETGHG